jgi:chemosensory pili system protein ChpA (sensor histidine kinase/response regulator)
MDEEQQLFAEGEEESQLSPEDLAILEAFRQMEDLEPPDAATPAVAPSAESPAAGAASSEDAPDGEGLEDMLMLFVAEADEDIAIMRQALAQLERGETLDAEQLEILRRTAHKLKGTAGAIGCTSMATIAYYSEMLVGSLRDGVVPAMIGLMALVQAVRALEATLQSIVESGQESSAPLTALEAEYEALNEFGGVQRTPSEGLIALTTPDESALLEQKGAPRSPLREGVAHLRLSTQPSRVEYPPLPSVHVEASRLKQLLLTGEHLAEQREPLEHAHRELGQALQELYAAQSRLQYLQTLLALTPGSSPLAEGSSGQRPPLSRQQPMSSLVARILEEAEQHGRHAPAQHRGHAQSIALKARESTSWDEMEIDRYTEEDVLLRAFHEAIADVSTASAQVRAAFTRLDRTLRRHMELAQKVRSDALLLRSTPLAALLPRMQRAIRMSADAQRRQVRFETHGEATEIDQDILEALARPLLQLLRYGMMTYLSASYDERQEETQEYRIWLTACAMGNEVSLELGFSTPVGPGALDLIQGPIQQLQGTVSLQRNALGGTSFYLTLPRSHGAMYGLLVRVGQQRIVLPFSQVRHIAYEREQQAERSQAIGLGSLLGLPTSGSGRARPIILLQEGLPYEALEVDEVLDGVELVVKPLASYLRRPGLMGAAIDAQGNVLLVADLSRPLRAHAPTETVAPTQAVPSQERSEITVLIADDSVYIRQSLQQTLQRAGYRVIQARDGMEAWELLLEQPPDVLLLDIEMPHLNGYELLSMIRSSPRFAALKIIMLTARSSEKHRRSASDLGAQAYLIKPSPPAALLETINTLLRTEGHSAASWPGR